MYLSQFLSLGPLRKGILFFFSKHLTLYSLTLSFFEMPKMLLPSLRYSFCRMALLGRASFALNFALLFIIIYLLSRPKGPGFNQIISNSNDKVKPPSLAQSFSFLARALTTLKPNALFILRHFFNVNFSICLFTASSCKLKYRHNVPKLKMPLPLFPAISSFAQ
jgi:hypothetical protein